jgi:hypothetical protein
MAPHARLQVVLDRDGLLPEDAVVNTWHFEADAGGGSDRDKWDLDMPGLLDRVELFYVTVAGIFAPTLAGTGRIKAYDLSDAKPRVPRVVQEFTFVPSTSDALPAEVALCLSFKGATESGVNMRRRKGRVFLGPLARTMIDGGTPVADVRPGTGNVSSVLTAAEVMATGGSGTFRLSIYSPTSDPGETMVDAAWNDAVEFWVDNAFDTQRRRGARATARQTQAITP